MTSAEEAGSTPEELLARALESLSSAERRQVTSWLLTRTRTRVYPGWSERSAPFPELAGVATGGALNVGQGHQIVPVRLPAELHSRLRLWSSENGFSMATVVRGLVSRFLDGQAPEPDADV